MHWFNVLLLLFLLALVDGSPISAASGDVTRSLVNIGKELDDAHLGNCTLGDAALPLSKTNPELPPLSEGLNPKYVTLGRGTQNYTCCSESSDSPVSIGARATLFDASCLAQYYPGLLHELPDMLRHVPVDMLTFQTVITGRLASPETGSLVVGEHYFNADSVPFFDLRFGGSDDYMMTDKKIGSAPAPSDKSASTKGDDGKDVAWLKLASTDGHGVQVSTRFIPLCNIFNVPHRLTVDDRKFTAFIPLVVCLHPRAKGKRIISKSSMRRNTGSLVDCFLYLHWDLLQYLFEFLGSGHS